MRDRYIAASMHIKAALVAGLIATAAAAPCGAKKQQQAFSCGAPHPSPEFMNHTASLAKRSNLRRQAAAAAIEIRVFANVIFHAYDADSGFIQQELVHRQISKLNYDFRQTGFVFTLMDVSYFLDNGVWSRGENELEMKSYLRQGDYGDLNIYFVASLPCDVPNRVTVGDCRYPVNLRDNPNPDEVFLMDGCRIVASSVPGAESHRYLSTPSGTIMTHECGHWLGLAHTFAATYSEDGEMLFDGCNGVGDYVDDTAPQKEAMFGCPSHPSFSCNTGIPDPIYNFMGYNTGDCPREFTDGQINLMHTNWYQYRVPMAHPGAWGGWSG